jgi:hypothetical protein
VSSTAIFWIALLGIAAAAGIFAWFSRSKRKMRVDARREMLRGSTTSQILGDIVKALDGRAWDHLASVGRVRALGPKCADLELLDAMKVLWDEACAEDVARGRTGRDSNEHQLYDSGLVRIMEVLEERVVRTRWL